METYCPKCNKSTETFVKPLDEILNVRGDRIKIKSEVTFCNECKEKVFNENLDDKNLNLAYSVYRKKHNLLTPTEITNIRKKYQLSQRALSKFLEWGEVTINRYETGAIQDPAHNEVLIFISDYHNMKDLFEKNNQFLSISVREKLRERINELIAGELKPQFIATLEEYMTFNKAVDEYSGFNKLTLEKVINMIHYIVEKANGVYTTKLNKLLWYSDFLYFSKYSKSISGSVYLHWPLGPVPEKYRWFITAAIDEGLINGKEACSASGHIGELFTAKIASDESFFSKEESNIMDFVIAYFKDYTCGDIKEKSHEEEAYKQTKDDEKISYKYASTLSLISDYTH